MYVILFITHYRYHSLTHLKTTAIEIQGNVSSPRASNIFDSSLITTERSFWGRVIHRSTEIVSFSIFGVQVRVL